MPCNPHSRTKLPELTERRQRCLLLGAKGAGMTALGEILSDLGHAVTGFDHSLTAPARFAPRMAEAAPAMRLLPWPARRVAFQNFDLCVASPAVAQHPLVQQMRDAGVPVLSLHACLAMLFQHSLQICVAGTHGKSTTSAMLVWILQAAGQLPGFFVGAHQPTFGRSGRPARKKVDVHSPGSSPTEICRNVWSVLESCEFSRSFHHFQPQMVVLTGMERDHFDCFPDQASEDEAFQTFVNQLPENGRLILNTACERSQQVAKAVEGRVTGFRVVSNQQNGADGFADGNTAEFLGSGPADRISADWTADRIQVRGTTTTFRLSSTSANSNHVNQQTQHRIVLPVPGDHNVANAVAAIAAAAAAGVPVEVSSKALASYPGLQRRFEIRGQYRGMILIDDYAHHPTALRTTLQTAKAVYPGRRLIVAFEPHQIVRTEALFSEFVQALQLADEAYVLPVFPARETATHQECCRASGRLVKELNRRGTKAFLFANLDQIVSRLDHSGRPTDIFITMGAGRTNVIHDQLIERLQRNSVA